MSEWREGSVLVLPGLHADARVLAARPELARRRRSSRADGPAPLQSVEGLSLGVDLTVRYALDPASVAATRAEPARRHRRRDRRAGGAGRDLQGVRALHGARDLLDQARRDPAGDRDRAASRSLAADGVVLRSVQIGKVDLPADYRRGMESLLAEELADREDALHARAEGQAASRRPSSTAQAEKVRRENGRRGRGARAGRSPPGRRKRR